MRCSHCGCICDTTSTFITTLGEGDNIDEAIKDLQTQINEESDSELKDILRAKKEQLKVENNFVQNFTVSVSEAKRKVTSAIKTLLKEGKGQYLLTLKNEDLAAYLAKNGLSDAVAVLINSQANLKSLVTGTVNLMNPGFNLGQSSLVFALETQGVQTIQEMMLSDTSRIVRSAVVNAATSGDVKVAITQLEAELDKATGRQIAEARTKLSDFNRGLMAISAEAAGLEYYMYSGPRDVITRPFCKKLVGKVVTAADMKKLNNGQSSSALLRGGGFNCRHSWTAVSKAFVDRLELPILTTKEVGNI
jgi:hypothetical protein